MGEGEMDQMVKWVSLNIKVEDSEVYG